MRGNSIRHLFDFAAQRAERDIIFQTTTTYLSNSLELIIMVDPHEKIVFILPIRTQTVGGLIRIHSWKKLYNISRFRIGVVLF